MLLTHGTRTSALLVGILAGLSGLHVFWALGGQWGLREALGGNELPHAALAWGVALILAGAVLVVLGRVGVWGTGLPAAIFVWGTWALAGAFALAGVTNLAGRTTLERVAFAPFCLLMAFLVLGIARSRAVQRPESGRGPLDRLLPAFTVRERHERIVACGPEEALEVALGLPVGADPVVGTLFRLRGLRAGRESIGEFTSKGGFLVLEQTPTTYVFGMASRLRGAPRQASDREGWLAWSAPGVKIVADFRAVRLGEGHSRLTTETRVLTLDSTSRVLFRLYWVVVGPFSALIRRRWLRAIATRAAQT